MRNEGFGKSPAGEVEAIHQVVESLNPVVFASSERVTDVGTATNLREGAGSLRGFTATALRSVGHFSRVAAATGASSSRSSLAVPASSTIGAGAAIVIEPLR